MNVSTSKNGFQNHAGSREYLVVSITLHSFVAKFVSRAITKYNKMRFCCFLIALASFAVAEPSGQALIQYDFSIDECHSQLFRNLGTLESPFSFLRNGTATKCSPGIGVEATDLFSSPVEENGVSYMRGSHSIDPLVNQLQSVDGDVSGITFSLWIDVRQNEDDMLTGPILAIGNPHTDETLSTGSSTTECDSRQLDFQLSIRKNFLELMYRTNDPFFEPCTRIRITELPLAPGIHHVAITLGNNHQQVFVDGQASTTNHDPFSTNLQHWKLDSTIYLFSFPAYEYPAWNGRIYQFSLYAEPWGSARAEAEMVRGLPASRPYALSKLIRMNEDAEVTPGSHSIDWYRTPRTFDGNNDTVSSVPSIDLPIGYPQYEINALLQALSIPQESTHAVKFYIISTPSHGELYDIDGTKINAGSDVATLLKGQSVVFLPFHNEHSPLPGSVYASFNFCVTKRVIFSPSQCESSGTVEIVVDPTNDPPIAKIGTPLYTVQEGIHEEPVGLKLSGEDVDIGDEITAIEVTTLPRYGFLYLSVPTRRDDGLLHGTALVNFNHTLLGRELYLEYRFLGSDQVVQGTSVKDSFKFRVADSHGTWSAVETAEIQVISRLSIHSPSNVIVKENEPALVRLHGTDDSGLARKVGYYFEVMPNETQGILFEGRNLRIEKNTIAVASGTEPTDVRQLNLTFQAAPEACSNGYGTEMNSSFTVRMVAFSENGQISSASPLIEQQLSIVCEVKPLSIWIPQERYTATIYTGTADDPCNGYNYNATTTDPALCPSAAIIHGIQVTGQEQHKEDVIVSVSALNGLLTINRDKREHVRAIDGQEEMRSSIKFLVHPAKLEEALSYLHFQTETVGTDEICITIHCQSDRGAKLSSAGRSECQDIVFSIQVEGLESQVGLPERLYGDFPWFSLSFTLTMLCLFKSKGKLRKIVKKWKSNDPQDDDLHGDCLWREHYDPSSGFYYYEHLEEGTVTWHAPIDEGIIPSPDRRTIGAERLVAVQDDDDSLFDDEPSTAETVDDNSSIGDNSMGDSL